MNIDQPLVLRLSQVLPALDDIQRRQPSWNTTCLATREAFTRLAAYELVARPEVLDYNPVLTTSDGRLYTSSTVVPRPHTQMDHGHGHHLKKGIPILRATALQVVKAVLGGSGSEAAAATAAATGQDAARQVVHHLVAIAPQQTCCWYNLELHKACAAPASAATPLATRRPHTPYVYCVKHWVPALRHGSDDDDDDNDHAITPASEQRLDEWLASIV